MTIDQRKEALINWIMGLEDESLLNKVEGFKDETTNDVPDEIVSLLDKSDSEPLEQTIVHTYSKNVLNSV
jgi:hypothetical protein